MSPSTGHTYINKNKKMIGDMYICPRTRATGQMPLMSGMLHEAIWGFEPEPLSTYITTHAHRFVYLYAYLCAYIYSCEHALMFKCIQLCLYVYACMHLQSHLHTCMYSVMFISMYACVMHRMHK